MDEEDDEIFLSLFNEYELRNTSTSIENNDIKTGVVKDSNTHIEYKILSALLFMSNLSKENYISKKRDNINSFSGKHF